MFLVREKNEYKLNVTAGLLINSDTCIKQYNFPVFGAFVSPGFIVCILYIR